MRGFGLGLALLALFPGHVQAEEASVELSSKARLELSRQIIDIAYPASERQAMFEAVGQQMEQQMLSSVRPHVTDPGMMAIVEKFQREVSQEQKPILERNVPLLMDAWAKAYAEVFSESELRDILAFVQTETGATFMMRSTEVMSNQHFAAANEAYTSEAMAVVMGKMPQLVEELASYRKAQSQD